MADLRENKLLESRLAGTLEDVNTSMCEYPSVHIQNYLRTYGPQCSLVLLVCSEEHPP